MRRIRTLGAAFVAALALTSAVSTSAVAAPGFLADSSPASLMGTNTNYHGLITNTASIACEKATFEAVILQRAHTITAAPSFGNCALTGTKTAATISAGKCRYVFHVTEGGSQGTVDIGPSDCGGITVSLPGCTVKLLPQTALTEISYQNQGTGSEKTVAMTAQLSGIDYKQSGFLCSSSGTFTNGIYTGTWQVAAQPGGFSVVDELPVGIHVAPKPQFEAEEFPVTIFGEQDAKDLLVLTTNAGSLECTEVTAEGVQSSAAAEVSVSPTFAGCYLTKTGVEATVNTNGCKYVFSVASESAGNVQLQCPEGKSMVIVGIGCTVTIPAQSHGSVSYENIGSGYNRTITAGVSGQGLAYSHKGFLCGTAAGNDGSFGGTLGLRGIG